MVVRIMAFLLSGFASLGTVRAAEAGVVGSASDPRRPHGDLWPADRP
jgi:hypothetical protein